MGDGVDESEELVEESSLAAPMPRYGGRLVVAFATAAADADASDSAEVSLLKWGDVVLEDQACIFIILMIRH